MQIRHSKTSSPNQSRKSITKSLKKFSKLELSQAISEQNEQLKKIRKISKFLQIFPYVRFILNLCMAVDNLWITMLMISFNTSERVESFVWILPTLIVILAKPYITRVAVASRLNRKYQFCVNISSFQLQSVGFCVILSGVGMFIVWFSCTEAINWPKSILVFVCSIGWITQYTFTELADYLMENIENSYEYLIKKGNILQLGKSQKPEKIQYSGEIFGYILCFVLLFHCEWNKYGYYAQCGLSHILAAFFCFVVGAYTLWKVPQNHQRQQSNSDKISASKSISVDKNYYIKGWQQLSRATFSEKLMLLVLAINQYMRDCVLIYLSMFYSYSQQTQQRKLGKSILQQEEEYFEMLYGVRWAAIMLIIYTVIQNYDMSVLLKFLQNKVNGTLLLSLVLLTLIINFSYKVFINNQFWEILCLLAVQGIFHQIFQNISLQKFNENFTFRRCKEVAIVIQKIFVLSLVPFFIMVLLNRDDVEDIFVTIAIASFLGIISLIGIYLVTQLKLDSIRLKTD